MNELRCSAPQGSRATSTAPIPRNEAGATDCDRGAAEALGLTSDGVQTVSVYFSTRSHADDALAMFRRRDWTKGVVAEVATYCLD